MTISAERRAFREMLAIADTRTVGNAIKIKNAFGVYADSASAAHKARALAIATEAAQRLQCAAPTDYADALVKHGFVCLCMAEDE